MKTIDIVKEFWKDDKTSVQNFNAMGISSDPNKSIPVPSSKQKRIKVMVDGTFAKEGENTIQTQKVNAVIETMELEVSKERSKRLRLPKSYINKLNYFLDKYKFDYDSMFKDFKNYDQWSAKQCRQRIKKYMTIQEQFANYLLSRNLTIEEVNNWKEYISDD
ncbi:NOP16 family protein [Megaselia abdita]